MLKSIRTADNADQLSQSLLRILQNTSNRGKECADALRSMYLLMCASRFTVKLPDILVRALLAVLSEPQQGPPRVRTLCFLLLQECCISKALRIDSFDAPVDRKQIPLMVPLLSSSIQPSAARRHGGTLAKWVAGGEPEIRMAALAALFSLSPVTERLLTAGQADSIDVWIREWLRNASNITGMAAGASASSSSSWFGRSLAPAVITEPDGSPLRDFFTVLNQASHYSPDQVLSVQAFAGLVAWISSNFGRTAVAPRKMDTDFTEVLLKYCVRIVDQTEMLFVGGPARVAAFGLGPVEAVLVEVIKLMDEMCFVDEALIPRLLSLVKRVYNNNMALRIQSGVVFVALMQFFLNHSDKVGYSAQAVYAAFFQGHINQNYYHPVAGYDVLRFCVDNRAALVEKTDVFVRYFPAILKLVAWTPWSIGTELLDLIPSMCSEDSFIELLHSLLDMPLISAGLETMLSNGDRLDDEASGNPMFRAVLNTVLRNESSLGNINFWSTTTMPLLQEFCATTAPTMRVRACAELVPHCLRVFFDALLRDGESAQLELVVSAVIERYMQLYILPTYQAAVRSVLVDYVLAIFAMHSKFVYSLRKPILAFLDSRQDEQKEELKLHLCWIIGEYASPSVHPRLAGEVIFEYFQTLEPLAYEANMALTQTPSAAVDALNVAGSARTPHFLTTLMSTLAKLAARSQDITPRVTICLAKIVKQQRASKSEASVVLIQRANELIRILQYPTIAAAILDPPPETARPRLSHVDRHSSLPMLLQPSSNDRVHVQQQVSPSDLVKIHPFLLV